MPIVITHGHIGSDLFLFQRLYIRITCSCNVYPLDIKSGVCRDIPIFLTFCSKHRLWVHVRTASPSKNKKNIKTFQLKMFNFESSKSPFIAQVCFRNAS